jgi:GTPase SAR1 family protein
MTGNYYRGANAVLVVFDITNKSSFDAVPNWIDEVLKVLNGKRAIISVFLCDFFLEFQS